MRTKAPAGRGVPAARSAPCPRSQMCLISVRLNSAVLAGLETWGSTGVLRGVTAPESVGRRCAQLQGSRADLALGPRLVHGALAFWMQTTGACQVRTSLAGSQRCLRWCMRGVVRPCCCTSRCTDLTLTRQGNPVRFPSASSAGIGLFVPKPSHGADCQPAARLTWERSSVSVRWHPPLAVAIVTRLVAR